MAAITLPNVRAIEYKFPTQDNNPTTLISSTQKELNDHLASARPILSQSVAKHIDRFIEYKRTTYPPYLGTALGGAARKALITRLIQKRPLSFAGREDSYLLRDSTNGDSWEPSDNLSNNFNTAEYLTYDEIAVGALLGVSSYCRFIDNGNRSETLADKIDYTKTGVFVGLVGPRFEKEGEMEWKHMIITETQNTTPNGYGAQPSKTTGARPQEHVLLSIWAQLYRSVLWNVSYGFPSWDEAVKDGTEKYPLIQHSGRTPINGRFNIAVYKERVKLSIITFLQEADDRGAKAGKYVHARVVGLGLGVWEVDDRQGDWMMQVYAEVIIAVKFPSIAVLEFVWFDETGTRYEDMFVDAFVAERERGRSENDTLVIEHTHNPIAKSLGAGREAMLLVAMYAWNGNSYPGNRYWVGDTGRSNGDLAAAKISTIPWIQNPDINERINGEYAVIHKDTFLPQVPAAPIAAAAAAASASAADVDLNTPVEMIEFKDLRPVKAMPTYVS